MRLKALQRVRRRMPRSESLRAPNREGADRWSSSLDRFLLTWHPMSARLGLGHSLPSVDPFPPPRLVSGLSKLPPSTLASFYWRVVGDRNTALCLHRVHEDERREGELQPWLSVDTRTLDALIDALVDERPLKAGRLTVTFDDGYRDAHRYVTSRAPRYPDVEWLFFVCAEKTVQRRGFRWDSYELRRGRATWSALQEYLLTPVAPLDEGTSEELAGLGDHPEFALATVDECLTLARLPNVRLGNHSDHHLCAASLTLDQLRLEARRSVESFTAVFGATDDFAFPFGTPGRHFGADHARVLAEETGCVLWSTEARPFASRERLSGAVVPRLPILGTWTLTEILASMVTTAVRSRTRRQRPLFSGAAPVRAAPVSPPAAPPRARARAERELPQLP